MDASCIESRPKEEGRGTEPLTDEQRALIESALPFAENVAAQVARRLPRGTDVDELRGAVNEKLVQLSRKFDPARGVPFNGFAAEALRGAAWDAARRSAPRGARTTRTITAARGALAVSEADRTAGPLDGESAEAAFARSVRSHAAVMLLSQCAGEDDMYDPPSPTPSAAEDASEREAQERRDEVFARLRPRLSAALERLEEADRIAVRGVFLEGRRLDDVAADLGGVNKSNVSRRVQKALARLADLLSADLRPGDAFWAAGA